MHVYFLFSLLVTNSIRRIFRLLIWNLITHTTSRALRSPKGNVRSLEGRNVNYQVGIEDPSRWEVRNSQLSLWFGKKISTQQSWNIRIMFIIKKERRKTKKVGKEVGYKANTHLKKSSTILILKNMFHFLLPSPQGSNYASCSTIPQPPKINEMKP